jgi:hypothetical protein
MDKCEKLRSRAQDAPGSLGFREICALAECHGFVLRRQTGSHAMYKHPSLDSALGGFMNFQSENGKAKAYQVRQLLKAIEYLEDDDE